MAIGPILNKRSRERIIARAERVIDNIIKGNPNRELTIALSLLPELEPVDWTDVLAPKYRRVGWCVAKWVNDPREGSYIKLKA